MLIGELSELTGCNAHQLRYYEEQDLLRPHRARNGYREYPEETVHTVASIRALLAVGLSTAEIKQILPAIVRDGDLDSWPEVWAMLRSRLDAVDMHIKALHDVRQIILDCRIQMEQRLDASTL